MIEPWVTRWSQFVYRHLHHEPFEPIASWEPASTGPLSGANSAIPWIIFERDRRQFEQEFPGWRIERITPMMPLVYVLSGGVSLRSFAPGWSLGAIRGLEHVVARWNRQLAMFAHIVVRRRSAPDTVASPLGIIQS